MNRGQLASAPEVISESKQAIDQLDAYVHKDTRFATNRKVTKRIARIREVLSTPAAADVSSKNVSTPKTTLLKRVMLKQMDKKIKHHLSPDRTMAKSMLTIGVIVGIVGLLLLILNVASPLGLIALIVGLALILIDLIR
ncbi:hypothetical protein GCM10027085_43270 [Spirosoma aerophilum]